MVWVVFSLLHSVVSQVLVETNRRNTPIGFSASFVWFVYFVVQKNCSGLDSAKDSSHEKRLHWGLLTRLGKHAVLHVRETLSADLNSSAKRCHSDARRSGGRFAS